MAAGGEEEGFASLLFLFFSFLFLRFGPEMLSMLHALVDGPRDHAEGTQCAHMF